MGTIKEESVTLAALPAGPAKQSRRYHPPAFKAQVVAECNEPGESIASIAIKHQLNPNMVQRWRREQRRATQHHTFLPVPMPAPTMASGSSATNTTTVRLEVPMPQGPLVAHWPVGEVAASVTWLKSLLT